MTIGMNKRFLAKILTLCMIVSMVQLPVSAASADTDTAPATGTGISWSVESDGTYKVNDDVTVSGTYTTPEIPRPTALPWILSSWHLTAS